MTFCKYNTIRVWNKKRGNPKEAKRWNFSETFSHSVSGHRRGLYFPLNVEESNQGAFDIVQRTDLNIRYTGDGGTSMWQLGTFRLPTFITKWYTFDILNIYIKSVFWNICCFFSHSMASASSRQTRAPKRALDIFPDLQHSTWFKNNWLVMNMLVLQQMICIFFIGPN